MRTSPLPALLVFANIAFAAHAETSLPFQVADNQSYPSAVKTGTAVVKYTCPMHPQVISDTPGKCPICGMDLVPLEGEGYGHDHGDMQGAPVIAITAENIQKMGVRTAAVEKSKLGVEIRASGIVMENERERYTVFSQVEGKVDALKATLGEYVHKGELFYTLNSEALYEMERDYVYAATRGSEDEARALTRAMVLKGFDESFIDQLAKTCKISAEVPYFVPSKGKLGDEDIRSGNWLSEGCRASADVPFLVPSDGIITKLDIGNGTYVKGNDPIATIQSLSSVWVEAAIPEKDIASVKTGTKATIILAGASMPYHTSVDYIYPQIDPASRTAKARLVVDNANGLLKPGEYADVLFSTGTAADKLTVPNEAILHTADGDHVIVALGDGKFQSRDIKTGMVGSDKSEIISGLKAGEEVVTSSQFLIDSESNLRASLNKISGDN